MKTGKIIQVMGPVVDVEFEDEELPAIRDALEVQNGDKKCIMEVAQHIGNNTVRCIMLAASEGLHRDMGYRTVAHDNPLTDEKQQETGRTLLGLKQTDMFEAIVSAAPDGNDKVSRLIDAYLTAFQRRIAAEDAGGPSPQAPVPEGFDVRDFA